jgi:Tfp pilus assembly protein PilX
MSRRAISISDADGTALIVVLLSMMLLSALGMALSITTSTETKIAAGYVWSAQTFYGAETGLSRAVQELSSIADWTDIPGGSLTSTFVDGAAGMRTLADGTPLDLNQATDLVNCGRPSCGLAEMSASTADHPWGANNPIWRLYAHGSLAAFGSQAAIDARIYVVVWVSDDPLENDGQPAIDGDETGGPNPGRGLVQLRAQAYGPGGSMRVIEATLRRAASRVRVISWREIR